ncbi:MAG: sensor histidine kinase [Maribacter sp.]
MIADQKLNNFLGVNSPKGYRLNYKYHILFWSVYFIFNTLRWSSFHNDFMYSLKTNLIGFPIHMALAYFNIYYLMPKYVYKGRYFSFIILILLALIIMLLLKYNLTYYLVSTMVMPEIAPDISHLTIDYAIQTMLGEIYVISFVTAIKITIDRLRENNKIHDLEKRQLRAELKFLRSQVSPHFFFNTLNNIYSLTLEKSDKAPAVILKLSEFMRYLLYSTNKPRQDLKNELDSIQNYIDLERIRFDDSLQIDVAISGELEHKKIAPMLLIPLVENCFKHGANKRIGKVDICIDAKVVDDFLYFKVSNTLPTKGLSKPEFLENSGIGLSNVKKRLELGYDPKDYALEIFEQEDKYRVNLKLKV